QAGPEPPAQDAHRPPRPAAAEHRAGDGPRHHGTRDHHLGHAHEIEADERAPQQQDELELEAHANSSSGTGRAVGTSWAVISIPCPASSFSLTASLSLRYT